jgi:hypothetical protein
VAGLALVGALRSGPGVVALLAGVRASDSRSRRTGRVAELALWSWAGVVARLAGVDVRAGGGWAGRPGRVALRGWGGLAARAARVGGLAALGGAVRLYGYRAPRWGPRAGLGCGA